MPRASVTSCCACTAGIDLPAWEFSSATRSARAPQAPAMSPAVRAVWAACTLLLRLFPGPTPCTAARNAASRWAGVGVGVGVGVRVGVRVGVLVGVLVGVAVGVLVAVRVAVAVGVGVWVL